MQPHKSILALVKSWVGLCENGQKYWINHRSPVSPNQAIAQSPIKYSLHFLLWGPCSDTTVSDTDRNMVVRFCDCTLHNSDVSVLTKSFPQKHLAKCSELLFEVVPAPMKHFALMKHTHTRVHTRNVKTVPATLSMLLWTLATVGRQPPEGWSGKRQRRILKWTSFSKSSDFCSL